MRTAHYEHLYYRISWIITNKPFSVSIPSLSFAIPVKAPPVDTQSKDETSAALRIIRVLSEPPASPLSTMVSHRHLFACALLSSLIRGNDACKRAAQAIVPVKLFAALPPPALSPALSASPSPTPSALTPQASTAIGGPPLAASLSVPLAASASAAAAGAEDDDPPQSLLAHLVGSVALIFRARAIAREQSQAPTQPQDLTQDDGQQPIEQQNSIQEVTDWDRTLAAYLCLLSAWCWDYDKGVKEILEEGGILGLVRTIVIFFVVAKQLTDHFVNYYIACGACRTRSERGSTCAGYSSVLTRRMLRVQ